jgi:hypothetical protein
MHEKNTKTKRCVEKTEKIALKKKQDIPRFSVAPFFYMWYTL